MVSFILGSGWKKKVLRHQLPDAAGRMGADGGYRTLAMDGLQRSCT